MRPLCNCGVVQPTRKQRIWGGQRRTNLAEKWVCRTSTTKETCGNSPIRWFESDGCHLQGLVAFTTLADFELDSLSLF